MNAEYINRQIAHHEAAAAGFAAEGRRVREAGDIDRAMRLAAMAKAEKQDAAAFRRRLAVI